MRVAQQRKTQQPWKDNDEWNHHFERGPDDGREFGRAQIFGGEHALHHQKVGGPVPH